MAVCRRYILGVSNTTHTNHSTAKEETMSNNDKAISAMIRNVATAKETLKKIQEHLEDHMNVAPENVNWGHAGDSSHIAAQLEEIAEFLDL